MSVYVIIYHLGTQLYRCVDYAGVHVFKCPLCMCFYLHVGLHCVYALPCMVKYLRMCSNLETANHVSCGLAY